MELRSISQNRTNQFCTCLIWKLAGSINCKPDIGDQERHLTIQETNPNVQESQCCSTHDWGSHYPQRSYHKVRFKSYKSWICQSCPGVACTGTNRVQATIDPGVVWLEAGRHRWTTRGSRPFPFEPVLLHRPEWSRPDHFHVHTQSIQPTCFRFRDIADHQKE